MLLQCHIRPILFCLEMLVSCMHAPSLEMFHGAGAALICSALSATLMLMTFWLQTSLHPQHAHCDICLWILLSACSLESTYLAEFLHDCVCKHAPSLHINVVKLMHATAHGHVACVSAALGRTAESIAALMQAEKLLSQLSAQSIARHSASDVLHGLPTPAEEDCWRKVTLSSVLLFDCFGDNKTRCEEAGL
jgi:hypothetical protein